MSKGTPPSEGDQPPVIDNLVDSPADPTIDTQNERLDDGVNRCPQCGATEIQLHPSAGMLVCLCCRHEWSEARIDGTIANGDLSTLSGTTMGSGASDIDTGADSLITMKCLGCGAEVVVNTAEQMGARCHWCRHVLTINEQVPNGAVPEAVVFGVGPSATAAQQLETGAGTEADTLYKLVHEHTNNHPPGAKWDLSARAVVIIDEAAMVDTRLLHQYSQIAQAKNWRTILVGDHRQLDAVDAGGMFAELVNNPAVITVELDTLHRFEHDWEAAASLELRDANPSAVDAYDRHGRIHGHADQTAAIVAVADAAFAGIVEGRDVLVLAPTNVIVDELKTTTITHRLLDTGHLDPDRRIDIGDCVFYPGQAVVTRANDRRLTYGTDSEQWVRNGDRWQVNSGTSDELNLTNAVNGHSVTVPADYVATGNVSVDYASTINRAQGATVDEAHLLLGDRTNSKQLYVGTTRGRAANHIHTAPPIFDPDQHGPATGTGTWTPQGAVAAALARQPNQVSALERRRQLRELHTPAPPERGDDKSNAAVDQVPSDTASGRAAAAVKRVQSLSRRRSQGLQR